MQQLQILKFVPYAPPHKGGLESHIQEWSFWWSKENYGNVVIITTPMGQKVQEEKEKIWYKNSCIGYKKDGYEVVILDAFDVIPVFPFPKFWTKKFWRVITYIQSQIKQHGKAHTIVNTHTRFFLTSFLGGMFAKWVGVKWIHIEHGVDYVKLASKWKSFIAYVFDQTIGRRIFRCSDMVIGISAGCERFAHKFTKKKIPVIHRGMDFISSMHTQRGEKKDNTILLGFVGRIVKLKGVDLLIEAFNNLQKKYPTILLEIVGDGDQLQELKTMVTRLNLENKVHFLGFREKEYIANTFLPKIDIVVNPSYQEGLPTSVLEGLLSKCVVVATNVGGTPEISNKEDLILVNAGSVSDLQKGLEYAILQYKKLQGLSYEEVKNHFDRKKSIEKYNEVYKGIF